EAGHPGEGYVSVMLHSFVGDDLDAVRETVRRPMTEYLRSSMSLVKGFAETWAPFGRRAGGPPAAGDELKNLSPEDTEDLLSYAFERYFETSGLFGTPES